MLEPRDDDTSDDADGGKQHRRGAADREDDADAQPLFKQGKVGLRREVQANHATAARR